MIGGTGKANARRNHLREVDVCNIAAFSYNLEKRGNNLEKKG